MNTTWLNDRTSSAARAPPAGFDPRRPAVNRALNYFNFTFPQKTMEMRSLCRICGVSLADLLACLISSSKEFEVIDFSTGAGKVNRNHVELFLQIRKSRRIKHHGIE